MEETENRSRFGGLWTVEKLDAVQRYLESYTCALRKKFQTIYIDAFAGSGECIIGTEDWSIKVDGSAKRALAITHPFNQYVLIEENSEKASKLEAFCKAEYPLLKTRVVSEDSNQILKALCTSDYMKNRRGVIFLDPFGASVTWETLQLIASTKHFDVWYLFPLGAINRFAAKDRKKVLEEKLTMVLGTDKWKEWYKENEEFQLEHPQIKNSYGRILELFQNQLEEIFPLVLPPAILKNNLNNPIFALYFACSNTSEKAITTSKKIAGYILNMFERGLLAAEIRPHLENLKSKKVVKRRQAKRKELGITDLFD